VIALDVVGIVGVEEADLVESSAAKDGITVALGGSGRDCPDYKEKKNAKTEATAVKRRHKREILHEDRKRQLPSKVRMNMLFLGIFEWFAMSFGGGWKYKRLSEITNLSPKFGSFLEITLCAIS
jgi:hypothetical protein